LSSLKIIAHTLLQIQENFYNISEAYTGLDLSAKDSNGTNTYFINPCHNTQKCADHPAAVCQADGIGTLHWCGTLESGKWTEISDGGGIAINYSGGESLRQTTVYYTCSASDGEFNPTPFESSKKTYAVYYATKYACPSVSVTTTSTSGTMSTTTGSTTSTGTTRSTSGTTGSTTGSTASTGTTRSTSGTTATTGTTSTTGSTGSTGTTRTTGTTGTTEISGSSTTTGSSSSSDETDELNTLIEIGYVIIGILVIMLSVMLLGIWNLMRNPDSHSNDKPDSQDNFRILPGHISPKN